MAPVPAADRFPAGPRFDVQQAAVRNSAHAARVAAVGQKLTAAMPYPAQRPEFVVPGTSQPEIYRHGDQVIVISEGLAAQCKTEGQLAALLSLQLAKGIADQQNRMQALTQANGREPPPEVRIGPDSGSGGDADQVRKAELAKLGQDRRKAGAATNPVDPLLLARQLLAKAGYAETDLEDAAPLLRAAGKSGALEEAAPARRSISGPIN
jgi:hypothetical protein